MFRYLLVAAALTLPAHLSLAQQGAKPTSAAARFEGDMAVIICQDLEKENQQVSFAQLDKPAATQLLEKVILRAFEPRQKEVSKLYNASFNDNSEVMRGVGQRVAGRLVVDCPAAMQLFLRMSEKSANLDITITDAERPLLTAIANESCAELTKANAQKPLRQQPKADRMMVVQQALQQSMKTHATEITTFYGAEALFDTPRIQSIGAKVGMLMANGCVEVIAAMGAD